MAERIELITLVIGIIVLLFLYWNRRQLKSLAHGRILHSSYICFVLGWILTVIESFALHDALNLLEHTCYLVGCILFAIWSYLVLKRGGPYV